jgi:hypothetical protein
VRAYFFGELAQMYVVFPFYFFCRPSLLQGGRKTNRKKTANARAHFIWP